MLVKLLLKVWPALLPWVIYFLWILFSKKILPFLRKKKFLKFLSLRSKGFKSDEGRIIEAEYVSSDNSNNSINDDEKRSQNFAKANEKIAFSSSKHFIILLYLSLILGIISVISFAF